MHNEMSDSAILAPAARTQRLAGWLSRVLSAAVPVSSLSPLVGDAGHRRYYRLALGEKHWIVVDDTSSTQVAQFLSVQAMLSAADISVPQMIAVSTEAGFLLQEDFGDSTYWHVLPDKADPLYADAFDTLIKIQQLRPALPPYDEYLLRQEMELFVTWYCDRHSGKPLSGIASQSFVEAADFLQASIQQQPQVMVHRDYHSRNLMVLADDRRGPGVLDFQDALIGAITYDIASLLRDAYVEWPLDQQRRWLRRYWQQGCSAGLALPADFPSYWTAFNITSAQRGLKVLGIFARLAYRDDRRRYLADLPVVHRHLLTACAEVPSLSALGRLVEDYPPLTDFRQ